MAWLRFFCDVAQGLLKTRDSTHGRSARTPCSHAIAVQSLASGGLCAQSRHSAMGSSGKGARGGDQE
jgi:hypothetical protein